MAHDPIVEEVRAAREAYGGEFDFDLIAICEDLRSKEVAGSTSYAETASPLPRPRGESITKSPAREIPLSESDRDSRNECFQ